MMDPHWGEEGVETLREYVERGARGVKLMGAVHKFARFQRADSWRPPRRGLHAGTRLFASWLNHLSVERSLLLKRSIQLTKWPLPVASKRQGRGVSGRQAASAASGAANRLNIFDRLGENWTYSEDCVMTLN